MRTKDRKPRDQRNKLPIETRNLARSEAVYHNQIGHDAFHLIPNDGLPAHNCAGTGTHGIKR